MNDKKNMYIFNIDRKLRLTEFMNVETMDMESGFHPKKEK